jgi:hypothetical protein
VNRQRPFFQRSRAAHPPRHCLRRHIRRLTPHELLQGAAAAGLILGALSQGLALAQHSHARSSTLLAAL